MSYLTFLLFSCLLGCVISAPYPLGTIVELTTDLGHVVYASLYTPDLSIFPSPRPALVVAHGSGGVFGFTSGYPTSIDREYGEWSVEATSRGYVALFVDSYEPKSGRLKGKTYANAAHIRPHDLYAGRAYLAGMTYVNASDISALGISHGMTSVLSALEDSDTHTSLRFKAAVGYYACCGCGECNTNNFSCSTQQCSQCPSCSLCSCSTTQYCPYAPMMIFAAESEPNPGCGLGYSQNFNPGYQHPSYNVNDTKTFWGSNWCDEKIRRGMLISAGCPITRNRKFQMLTYNQTYHGFDYLDDPAYPNNECARLHSRAQTFNWLQNTVVSLTGPNAHCARQLYPGFLP